MGGFEGLNITKAGEEIQAFYDNAMHGYNTVLNACTSFFNGLTNYWASPNAVDFSKKYTVAFSKILDDIIKEINHIQQGAREAGTTLAIANGAAFNVDIPVSININAGSSSSLFAICKETLNGATGMEVPAVKQIRTTFEDDINKGINDIRNIDDKIQFYSANDILLDTYSSNIKDFADDFETLLKEAFKDLNGFIQTEEDVIFGARQQATEAML